MADQTVLRASLPCGDVMKRVAYAIHNQLQNILHNMRIQSPELRTQSLLSFISRSKKKLSQLLAITRWLDFAGIPQFFSNMSQLQLKISTHMNRLNENQDALYFTHSQLFSHRIRSLDVISAKDILARGTYPHLPASIFSCGLPWEDPSQQKIFDEETLRRNLNIFLRSKLALVDPIPADIDFSSIRGGLLTVRLDGMFEMILTLDYLDSNSPWNILKFKLCVKSHVRESFDYQQNVSGVENDILTVLRSISVAASPSALTSELESSVPLSSSDSRVQTAAILEEGNIIVDDSHSNENVITSAVTTGIDNNKNTEDNSNVVINTGNIAILPRLHTICEHSSYATALRYFYIQALELSRTIWNGICEAEFQEKTTHSQMVFRFWRSNVTGFFQYELRVIQLRSPLSSYSSIDSEVVLVDADGKQIGGDVGLAPDARNFIRNSKSDNSINSSGKNADVVQSTNTDKDTFTLNHRRVPQLFAELWTCSAPDDSEGSLRIKRRRVLRNKAICTSSESNTNELNLTSNGNVLAGGGTHQNCL